MRKGSAGGSSGLYHPQQILHHPQYHIPGAPGGPPLPPQQQQFQQQYQQYSQGATANGMVQQRPNQGTGRIFVNNHHPQGTGNPYMQGGGILLPHPHSQGGPPPLQHQSQLMHHGGQRPIIPHGGAGFGSHPSGMGQGYGGGGGHQYGGGGINSHFGASGGSGGGSGSGGSSHSSSGGGDLPPVETVVARLETACRLLHGIGGNNTRVAEISSEIQILSEDLRRVGAMLENTYPEVLDRVMSSMRDASAQPCLPPSLRLAIFELVELRASKWILPSDSSNYYRQRRNLNDAAAQADLLSEERSGRTSANSGGANNQVTVVVTGTGSSGNNGNGPIKPEAIFPGGGSPQPNNNNVTAELDTPPQPQPAKTYREEIVIKNSDSGKVAPTAKERVLSINGYSQQSINLAKQLIQETITRNASPVLDGMVLPAASSPGSGDFGDGATSLLDDTEAAIKRLQLQGATQSSGGNSGSHGHPSSNHHHGNSHFSYTVSLGQHSIKILGDDLQYVQEAKMALDDYFQDKYPDLFSANDPLNDVTEEDEDEEGMGEELLEDESSFHRYDRETLLSLSKIQSEQPDFSHLEPEIQKTIVLEKPRPFDLDKFSRETSSTASGISTTLPKVTNGSDNLPG